MVYPRNRFVVRLLGLALLSVLLTASPAPAQIVISHDRSVVNIGRQRPLPMSGTFVVNPVVVGGNRFVRVSGSYSAVFVNPTRGFPGTGFVMPFSAGDRARAANFTGTGGPIVTGPFQKWW